MKFKLGPAALHFGYGSLKRSNWYLDRRYNPTPRIGVKILLRRTAFDSALLVELLG